MDVFVNDKNVLEKESKLNNVAELLFWHIVLPPSFLDLLFKNFRNLRQALFVPFT